jgi:hypothetical protein
MIKRGNGYYNSKNLLSKVLNKAFILSILNKEVKFFGYYSLAINEKEDFPLWK